MSYDTEANRTFVTARFRNSGPEGAPLQLPDPSSIEYRSLALRGAWDRGTGYVAEQAGASSRSTSSRSPTRTDARTRTHLPFRKRSCRTISPFTRRWETRSRSERVGEPITDHRDEVTFLVAPTGMAGVFQRAQCVTRRIKGAKPLELSAERPQELGVGRRNLRWERIRRIPLQAATDSGGNGKARYVSAPVAVAFAVDKGGAGRPEQSPERREGAERGSGPAVSSSSARAPNRARCGLPGRTPLPHAAKYGCVGLTRGDDG